MKNTNGKATNTNGQHQVTLVKANGDRVEPALIERVEQVESLSSTVGATLRNDLLKAFAYVPIANDDSADAKSASYSKAVLKGIGDNHSDRSDLIEALEDKIKVWTNAGNAKVALWEEKFQQWALGLAPIVNEDGTRLELKGVNGEGFAVTLPAEKAIIGSVNFLLYSLTSLSNSALLGEEGKVKKNGKKSNAKLSVFENTKRTAQSGDITGGNENWGFRAGVNYLVNSGAAGVKYCKAIELIGLTAKMVNLNVPDQAEKFFQILTGQVPTDKRFNFDDGMIRDLVTARGYGILISGARQWIKELKEKSSEDAKAASWQNTESIELAEMMADIKRKKAFDENHPQEDKINPDAATLPNAVYHPITWSDKAVQRVKKIGLMFTEDFKRGELTHDEIMRVMEHLAKGEEISEVNFDDNFSNEAINEALYRVIYVPQEAIATATV